MKENQLDWSKLHVGHISKDEIKAAINLEGWQSFRHQMKGKTLEEKYEMLSSLSSRFPNHRLVQVAITNYINALKRAGLIKQEDML